MYIKTVIKFAVGALLALVASLGTQAIAQTSTAPSGAITYLQNDLTGNVILATDASGATVWDERYLPYGGKRLGSSSSQKYGYHQKALDPETGLQYFGARYYDPLSGRFSGMDPLAPTEANIYTFNRYAFANGNPYRYTDPDGKVVVDVIFVAYDIYKLATEGATTTNLVATGLDVASTFGFGFGAGTIFRAARVAEHAAEGARAVEAGIHAAEGAGEAGVRAEAKGGTYVLRDTEGNVVRTGRSNNLARREAEHARDPELQKYEFNAIHETDVYAEQRGLEEKLNKLYNAPLDKINAISPRNKNIDAYRKAADEFLRRAPE